MSFLRQKENNLLALVIFGDCGFDSKGEGESIHPIRKIVFPPQLRSNSTALVGSHPGETNESTNRHSCKREGILLEGRYVG